MSSTPWKLYDGRNFAGGGGASAGIDCRLFFPGRGDFLRRRVFETGRPVVRRAFDSRVTHRPGQQLRATIRIF